MCEQSRSAQGFLFIFRNKSQSFHPMKRFFSQFEAINIRGCGTEILFCHLGGIIKAFAEARMCLEFCPVWHVHRTGGNVVHGSPFVGYYPYPPCY